MSWETHKKRIAYVDIINLDTKLCMVLSGYRAAVEKAIRLDPLSLGNGVRQFRILLRS